MEENKEIINNICVELFKTKKEEQLKDYMLIRKEYNNYPITKGKISKKVGVGTKTISKWDKIMLNNNFMFKDGYFYMKVEKLDSGEYKTIEVDKWEYNTYWKNKVKTRAYEALQQKFMNGTITLNEYTLAIDGIAVLLERLDNKYYYRIQKYKINEKNQLINDIYNLIMSYYSDKDIDLDFELINDVEVLKIE